MPSSCGTHWRPTSTIHAILYRRSCSAGRTESLRSPSAETCAHAALDLDWRQGRVYFLAFLNPPGGQPVPALTARLASLCNRKSANDRDRLIYRFCRVEVRLTVDGAVSAAAGTPEVGLGDRGRGRLVPDHHRCVDREAELRCQEFLDSLVDVGGCWAVKKFPASRSARARSGPAVAWHPGSPAPGSCRGGRPGTLIGGSRRSVSRAAAVTRMYQRGRRAPLPGIRVNGGVVKVASGSEPVTCGQ